MEQDKVKSKRGGKREGAGRPVEGEPKKGYNIYTEIELMEALNKEFKANKIMSRDQYITRAIKRAAKKDNII